MLVQCPNCLTTYKVSDSLVATPSPALRCSRCKHIFVLGAKAEATAAPETPTPAPVPARPEEERELSFSFPPSEKGEVKEEETDKAPDPSPAEEQPSSSPPSFTIPEENQAIETHPPNEAAPQFEDNWQASPPPDEEKQADVAPNPDPGNPLSAVLYGSLLALLLVIYGLLTLTHQTKPQRLEGFLKAIPWLGPSIFRNNHLPRGITLKAVAPSFQPIRGNRDVFVISGLAVNRNLLSVREVRIEGAVYNAEGKEIERQAVTVGNPISLKIIKAITAQDISTLQKLRPPQRFEIPPQESAAFIIVFLKPTRDIKSFHYQVLSAEGMT
jgi:predicted Zn finger-like uncharacterized protein